MHGTEYLARRSQRLRLGEAGNAEISHPSAAGRPFDENILRLYVAVNDAMAVGVVQREGDITEDRRYCLRRQHALRGESFR